MKNKRQVRTILVTVLLILSLLVPVFAETIEELEEQKKAAQQNITNDQTIVNQTSTVVDQIEKQIVEINKTIDSLTAEVTKLKEQITALEATIEQTQKELEEAVQKEKEQNDLLNERIRIQYMYGVEGYSQALFSEEDFTKQVENTQILSDIFKADNTLLEQLKQNRQAVEEKRKQLEAQKLELNSKKTELDSKVSDQENARSQKEAILEENQSVIKSAKSRIAQEEASIAAANARIQEIVKESERKAIAERQTKVADVEKQVAAYSSEVSKINDQIVKDYSSSSDSKITDCVRQIQAVSASLSEKDTKLKTMVDQTETAESAAKAVEVSSDVDDLLVAAAQNVSDAKSIKSELEELNVVEKKEEAQRAAKDAQAKRDEAVASGQQAVIQEAEAALKKAQEEAQKAQEEADKVKAENPTETEKSTSPKSDQYISSTGWHWPLEGVYDITSLFGYRIHPIFGEGRGHEGLDIGASSGTPIHSCDAGTVILAGENGGYGNCVIIQQNSGHQVYYGHQSKIAVTEGQTVDAGEVIGYVGSTGWSTGPHLHLGVLAGGSFVDPLTFFPELE